MTDWIAKTQTGRTYSRLGGDIRVEGDGYFHNAVLRSLPPALVEDAPWTLGMLNNLPMVDRPVVGERLYVLSEDADWRISTPIVSVEDR